MRKVKMYSPGFKFTCIYLLENKPKFRYWLIEFQVGKTMFTNKWTA